MSNPLENPTLRALLDSRNIRIEPDINEGFRCGRERIGVGDVVNGSTVIGFSFGEGWLCDDPVISVVLAVCYNDAREGHESALTTIECWPRVFMDLVRASRVA